MTRINFRSDPDPTEFDGILEIPIPKQEYEDIIKSLSTLSARHDFPNQAVLFRWVLSTGMDNIPVSVHEVRLSKFPERY